MTDEHSDLPRMAISVAEFCQTFAVGKSLFYEEVKAGRLSVRKVGGRTLVPTAEARAWWASKARR
ncbi:MAG: DNA-binding protein [Cupriavidus sp.]|nr:MAG: DNA-binding protein [Cupriavidus sp.]